MCLRHAACAALLALSLAACGPRPVDHATLAAAQTAGAIGEGLLPDGLPPSTALIRIERDSDRAAGYFHFSSGDYAAMAARFVPLAQLPADPALQTWVKRKDLAGYEAYTLAQSGRIWLLLCAQNKGRCYFRLLG
jgi:hypothetical protein